MLIYHNANELYRSEIKSRQTDQQVSQAASYHLAKKQRALMDLKGPQASNIVPVFRLTKA